MAHTPQEAPEDDAVLTRIGQAVMLHRGGDREEARNRLARLWQEMQEMQEAGAAVHPLHRCTLAHYMADTQDDPADELMWDLLALAAADAGGSAWEAAQAPEAAGPDGTAGSPGGPGRSEGCAERPGGRGESGAATGSDRHAGHGSPARAVRALYPSLHLNLALDYVKLGQEAAARSQLALARASAVGLADDAYADGVRAAIGRLSLRLEGGTDGPRAPDGSPSP